MFNSSSNKTQNMPVIETISFTVKAVKSYVLVSNADCISPFYKYKYIVLSTKNVVYNILSDHTVAVLEFSEGAILTLDYEKKEGFFTDNKKITKIHNADINHVSTETGIYLELITHPSETT